MIDLKKSSGLPIQLDEKTFQLKFNAPLAQAPMTVRKFEELKPVLKDPNAKPPFEDAYYVYRDIFLPKDEQTIREHEVRYDITVLPAGTIGKEYNKTMGHIHSFVPDQAYTYPELYEVLYGHALFLIQKKDPNSEKIVTVMAIRAGVGDKVVYPPNYAHIIVNIGKTVLVTANWVSSEYTADYEPIKDKHGMAYYVLHSTDKQFEVEANKNYPDLPEIRFAAGHMNTSLGFLIDEPMYETAMRHPGRLEFLNKPHKFAVELSSITS
jgi:glucose-6-phosphate isomerase